MIHPLLQHADPNRSANVPFPMAYFFHEKKHQEAHEFFFQEQI
jgi:hypothetical protein